MLPLNSLISAATRCSQLDRVDGTNCVDYLQQWLIIPVEYFKLFWLAPQDHRRNTWIHIFQNHTPGVESRWNQGQMSGFSTESSSQSMEVPSRTLWTRSTWNHWTSFQKVMKSFSFKKKNVLFYFQSAHHRKTLFLFKNPIWSVPSLPVTPSQFLAFHLIMC